MVVLSIFHVRELIGQRREAVVRAYSSADTAALCASMLGVSVEEACDESRFSILEVYYGDEFAEGGPRGVIAIF
jgi:hypothetical protein